MKLRARLGEEELEVEVERDGERFAVEIGGEKHVVDARQVEDAWYSILDGTRSYEVWVEPIEGGYRVSRGMVERRVELLDPAESPRAIQPSAGGPEPIVSAMAGKVVRVLVTEGDVVEPGQGLLVLEAMKMENEIAASRGGRVQSLAVEPGQTVEGGMVLLVIDYCAETEVEASS